MCCSFRIIICGVAVLAGYVPGGQLVIAQTTKSSVDFNRDVRPILSEKCFRCHGFNEADREADLRLDLPEIAHAARGDVTPLKPGDPDGSEVWLRISSDDDDVRMPPADSNLELTSEQKATIREWIVDGAKYSAHWAFVAPRKMSPPAVDAAARVANAIDQFVVAHLTEQGLSQSPAADPHTLIRRLSFDLTGLPPSADEVAGFTADGSPEAYELLVDRLLDSPHFGERLAIDWLDAARYADTNGFSIDGGRHMWLWRDWVIHAFNTNKPFDEFLVEQIAGDLLPDATTAQIVASGFQRNNMVTHEGGTIPAENLTNYNADRVKTLGEAVLGLTLGCAQCHDHKYDPITQQDYYRLFAYFNTLSDIGLDGNAGVNPRPYIQARTVLQTGEEAQLRRRITRQRERMENPPASALAAWEDRQRAELARRGAGLQLLPVTVQRVSTPNRGAGFEIQDARFVRITQPSGLAAYDVLAELPAADEPITGIRVVFHPDAGAPGNGWGYGPGSQLRGKQAPDPPPKGNFKLTALSVSVGAVPADQVDLFRLIPASRVTANTWSPENLPKSCLDPRNDNGWSPPSNFDGPVYVTFTFDQPVGSATTPYLTAQLNFGAGDNQIASRIEILAMTGADDGSALTAEVIEAIKSGAGRRTPEQAALVRKHFANHAPQMRRTRVNLANAEQRLAVLTREFPTMVMNVSEKPRDTFVLHRGDYSQPTVKVSMNTPEFLPRTSNEQTNRLSLARWITLPDHPLTARVYVNRVWQMLFGAGIVRTPADFGSQGEWPTHPELLDYLAVEFVESGWDVKALVKTVVMSEAYRQSSVTSPALARIDPQNRLLARGPRFRLSAEFIRDAALKTSGLLTRQLGGPSVNPYTPGDPWREISHYGSTPATAQAFVQDHGEKLYRRSLYTFWKRTAPPPNMAVFDAPNRETCVVSRPATNTPLQALVMLNDTQFVEAARAFAERMLERGADDGATVRWAIAEALSRPATDLELKVLGRALARERQRYASNRRAARKILAVGESPRNRDLDVPEHAAWTQIASMILNLSESVTRN